MYLLDATTFDRRLCAGDTPHVLERVLGDLARLTDAYGLLSVVVFGGPPRPNLPDGAYVGRVRLFFAPMGAVNQRIVDLVVRERGRWPITVVTGGDALGHKIARLGVLVMRPGAFREVLAHARTQRGPPAEPQRSVEDFGGPVRPSVAVHFATADPAGTRSYRPDLAFALGERLAHPAFGAGVVVERDRIVIHVQFACGVRRLRHGDPSASEFHRE
jgi:hypothetical protein